jgi:molybdenum cofactor cytidylyltransferase
VIIPSYQHRRGHPILLPRWTWQEVLELPHGETLRTVINRHAAAIHYLAVDTPTVLADVDTPEQYRDALDIHTP